MKHLPLTVGTTKKAPWTLALNCRGTLPHRQRQEP